MADSVAVEIQTTKDTERILDRLPGEMRSKARMQALRAAGRVVANRAKKLAPRSSKTGTTQKLSATEKSSRNFPAKPLAETIGVKVVEYGENAVALIGPSWPAGAHGHLIEFGHEKVLWGDEVSGTVKPQPFIRPAADETKAEQQTVMATKIMQHIDRVAGGT